jgi:FkbM family methyltransferase
MEKFDEQQIYDWMTRNLPHDPVIWELGAHHGEDSEKFLEMFPPNGYRGAQVTAFEPDPRNLAVINAKKNRQFTIRPLAIGAKDEKVDFHLSGGFVRDGHEWAFSSSVRKPKEHLTKHPTVKFIDTVQVQMMRLDSYYEVAQISVIDFIWCDVQGNEADVIEGGMETLKHTRYFYTEFDDKELYEGQKPLAHLQKQLEGLFTVVGLFGNNVLFRNTTL